VYPDANLASAAVGQITFDATGKISGPLIGGVGTDYGLTFAAGAIPSGQPNPSRAQAFCRRPSTSTSTVPPSFGVAFAVSNLSPDGYTSGGVTGLTRSTKKGVITTTYSNGQNLTTGRHDRAGRLPQLCRAWRRSAAAT